MSRFFVHFYFQCLTCPLISINSGGKNIYLPANECQTRILQSMVDNRAQVQRPVFVRALSIPHATLVELKRQQQRPLLAKGEMSQQVPRSQHLILPKNLPEQLGKIEQIKEVKIAPKLKLSDEKTFRHHQISDK